VHAGSPRRDIHAAERCKQTPTAGLGRTEVQFIPRQSTPVSSSWRAKNSRETLLNSSVLLGERGRRSAGIARRPRERERERERERGEEGKVCLIRNARVDEKGVKEFG